MARLTSHKNKELPILKKKFSKALIALDVPTPALAKIKEWNKTLKELWRFTHGKVNLFLLCIPAGPGNDFDDGTPEIMKSLETEFGSESWKHSIVVLTYSNLAFPRDTSPDNAERNRDLYIAHLHTFADKFREEIHKLGGKMSVKTIFQHQLDPKNSNAIIVIPAGYQEEDPVISGCDNSWIDDISNLITTKCDLSSKLDLRKNRLYRNMGIGCVAGGAGGVAAGAAGGAAGAGIGALLGAYGGRIGIAIGEFVGAAIGGSIGAASGVVGGGAVGAGLGASIPLAKNLYEEEKEWNKQRNSNS